MIENWKDIKNFEGLYEASSLGRIRRIHYDTKAKISQYGLPYILKCSHDKDGYEVYTLIKNGKSYRIRCHRLVALAFIPNPYNKPQVNHKDGIKNNNKVENLEWVTSGENRKHAYDTGLQKPLKGETHPSSKIVEKYDKNGILLATYSSAGEAGRENNIKASHIRDCCRGELKTSMGYIWKYKNQ